MPQMVTLRKETWHAISMTGTRINGSAGYFGRQMKKERLARGWSIQELARRMGVDAPHLGRVESGKRPPTERLAVKCDEAFPERRGWFLDYYEESKSWVPAGFRSWPEYEDKAASLRVWSPGVLDGLVQTEDYARAVLSVSPGVGDEVVTARLANRMERQRRLLRRDDPAVIWFVVDELALYRLVGSTEIMAAQLRRLLEIAALPKVTVTVLPAVIHPANESGFIIADDSAAYAEHVVGGFVYSDEQSVTGLTMRFDSLRAESCRASESLRKIERLGETWSAGVNPLTAGPTAASA
jgi:transcriptional regulator with XRE-family HTH domain